MNLYKPHKDTPPEPLYIITYFEKPTMKGFLDPIKGIYFQSEEQYQSWLTTSYAKAKEKYIVKVERRNDIQREPGKNYIYQSYIEIYP